MNAEWSQGAPHNNRMQEATWQGRHDKGVKARRGSG